MPIIYRLNTKIRSTMLCLSGFELYSRWVPLDFQYSGSLLILLFFMENQLWFLEELSLRNQFVSYAPLDQGCKGKEPKYQLKKIKKRTNKGTINKRHETRCTEKTLLCLGSQKRMRSIIRASSIFFLITT